MDNMDMGSPHLQHIHPNSLRINSIHSIIKIL